MSEDNRNRARFVIYALAGAYLLYLAWQLFQGLEDAGSDRTIMIVAIIAFTLIGAAAVIVGVYVSGKQMKERYDAQLEYETKKARESEKTAGSAEAEELEETDEASSPGEDTETGEAPGPGVTGEPDGAGEDVQNAGTEETEK